MAFVDKIVSSKSEFIYKVNATDSTGRRAFYYILVDKLKLKEFLAMKPDGRYDLADFGQILASGYGDEPSDDVKAILKEKYGFNF